MSGRRERHCKKCGDSHTPPTGKNCHRTPTRQTDSDGENVAGMLRGITEQLGELRGRLSNLEAAKDTHTPSEANPDQAARQLAPEAPPALTDSVRARMAELRLLSDSDSDDDQPLRRKKEKKGKRSGRGKTSDDVVVREVDWPHFYVYRGHSRKPATYENLSIAEFVFGYVSIVLDGQESAATQATMLSHLRELMHDAMDFPWHNVRNFHGVVLNQMELARISWQDGQTIENLRRTYSRRSDGVHEQTSPSGQQTPLCCFRYQRGDCPHPHDHRTSRGLLKHMCAFCLNITGSQFPHAEVDCERKKRMASKNGPSDSRDQPEKH